MKNIKITVLFLTGGLSESIVNSGRLIDCFISFFKRILCTVLFAVLFSIVPVWGGENVFLFDNFDNVDQWKHIELPLTMGPSKYVIVHEDGKNYLKAMSNNSASTLQYMKEFNVYQYPIVRWRWRVDNIYGKGDETRKSGDDYPFRVYINFKYVKKTASSGLTFRYNFVKAAYGLEIPQSSLSYIYSNKMYNVRYLSNTFDPENSKLVVMRSGTRDLGKWFDEEINIVEDYKAAFGKNPPEIAYIAVMCDSDNTGEKATAFLDFVEVSSIK